MTVVCIGEVVVDWLAVDCAETFEQAHIFCRAAGGNATNVAIGLSRLGTKATLIGKVGDDIHGHYLKGIIASEGLDTSGVLTVARFPTAQCYVMTKPDGEHTFYNWPKPHAADMLHPEEILPGFLEGASCLHATGISFMLEPRRSAVLKAIKLASDARLVISFDAGFPSGAEIEARKLAEQALYQANLLKLNRRELIYWSGASSQDKVEDMAYDLFKKYQPVALLATLGSAGSLVVTSHGLITCQPFNVHYVNGVGAGDGFVAGVLHAVLKQLGDSMNLDDLNTLSPADWEAIAYHGNAVGAYATTTLAAYEGLPTSSQLAQLLHHVRT